MKLKSIVKITLIAMVIGLILTVAGCSINKGFSFNNINADNKSENNLIINCETGRIELNFK